MGQVAWRLGVSVREHRELEAGARWPNFETWDRICKLLNCWPQTFVREPRDPAATLEPATVVVRIESVRRHGGSEDGPGESLPRPARPVG